MGCISWTTPTKPHMNKSKSSPNLTSVGAPQLRASISLCDLREIDNSFYFEEFFEGDGPLGIIFVERETCAIVKKISPGTVAAETYGLQVEMVLLEINGNPVSELSYSRTLKKIKTEWVNNNYVHLKFKKKMYPDVSAELNRYNLFHYYDSFVELGAKELVDFNFVVYSDLVKMGMSPEERDIFITNNPSCLVDE